MAQARKQKWSQDVTEHSDALDLKHDIFKGDAKSIAHSLKLSAERSTRRKTSAFQSAMSMLTFYINRAGANLPASRKKVLDKAKASFATNSVAIDLLRRERPMNEESEKTKPDMMRRAVLVGGALAGLGATAARAQETKVTPARGAQLQGKVAVVTGAARGIGRAIAEEMAANGADVVVADICGFVSPASNAVPASRAELDETTRRIETYGRRAMGVTVDIRDIAALRGLADQVEKAWGKIDIVVANAAIQRWKPLLEMDDHDWRDVIDNNLNGTANTIRAFAPTMVAREYGRIIVVASMQGKHGTKDASSYSASKWGILGLMKSAAIELGRHKITVNAVIPGLVDTALTRYETRYRELIGETQSEPPAHPTPDEAWKARLPQVPLKVGWLQPADIAPAAVFLASDGAAMVTGAEYEVTAGDSAHDI